jgi:hypothetical protein
LRDKYTKGEAAMSSEADETARPETIVSVISALRETSANSVMYSQATADKAGD